MICAASVLDRRAVGRNRVSIAGADGPQGLSAPAFLCFFRCRPTPSLAFFGPMQIAMFILGGLLGGGAVWLFVRARAATSVSLLQARLDHERATADEKLELVNRANEEWERRFEALSAKSLKSNNEAFLSLARHPARPAPGRPEDVRLAYAAAREGTAERIRRAARAGAGAREGRAGPPVGDGKPRDRVAHAARPRTLGRDPAQAGRRARGHGRPLRLRRAGEQP